MKNAYRKFMDKKEKESIEEQLTYIRLMLDKQLTPEQMRIVKKALGYCWVDGLIFQDQWEGE